VKISIRCRRISPRRLAARVRRVSCLFALSFALLVAPELRAQSEDGEFLVRTATHELIDGVYYADAQIYLQLSAKATEALHEGLPLTIRVEVQIMKRLRVWWDPVEHEVVLRSTLSWHPVTNRYRVYNIRTGEQRAFETLAGALEGLGQIDDLPIIDAAVLDPDDRYEMRIRAVLDKDDLPGPLRLLAFWRRDWSIASDWLQWLLEDE
jgi:hypothetical protein